LTKGSLQLVRCRACRFVQQHPLPEAGEYDGRYTDAGSYGTQQLPHKHLFLQRDVAVLQALAARGAAGPLLDVGAGAGIMLEAARAQGWRGIGLELAQPSVAHIRDGLGCEVHACAIEQAPLEPGSVGVVTFSHSLEHLLDPVGALRSAARLLRASTRDGYVHVAVPHWRAAKRLLAGKGIAWIFPEHISYFTQSSLRAAFAAAGFEVVEMRTCPMVCDTDHRFVITVFERFGLDRLVRRFLRMGERPLASLLADHVQIACPVWRLRFVNALARGLLRLWPERLLSWLGFGEELRATARVRSV
jgi:SAM-dependent methyltransferase